MPVLTMGQSIDYESTFKSNGSEFRIQQIQLEKYMTLLKVSKSKTVILADTLEFFTELQLIDFNEDKAMDIQITFTGNVDTQLLYLFNYSKSVFKKVLGFEKFPSAKQVKGKYKGFYFSYHRSGCADNYWTSDLFKIIDFKTIHLGQIFGAGCEEPRKVKVYKVTQNKKVLVETLPYKKVEENTHDKWGFIDDYWTKNYEKFR